MILHTHVSEFYQQFYFDTDSSSNRFWRRPRCLSRKPLRMALSVNGISRSRQSWSLRVCFVVPISIVTTLGACIWMSMHPLRMITSALVLVRFVAGRGNRSCKIWLVRRARRMCVDGCAASPRARMWTCLSGKKSASAKYPLWLPTATLRKRFKHQI